jgi:transaldolase
MREVDTPAAHAFDDTVVTLGMNTAAASAPQLASSPQLHALRQAGTAHVYADTASVTELGEVLERVDGRLITEIDGNTVNQPLVRQVLEDILDDAHPTEWAEALVRHEPELSAGRAIPFLYAVVCGRIARTITQAFAGNRRWEVSLQLHMGLCEAPDDARRIGRLLHRMAPGVLVKVPFTPHEPACVLVARDLEREGIPVNFTSTFSARQVMVAALLAGVARTNVFMGRLDQGLRAERLGEQVCLAAQRALRTMRERAGVRTLLIVASMREWRSFVRIAGCDCYTAPTKVLDAFLGQTEAAPPDIRSRLETSYEDRLGIAPDVVARVDPDRIARLWRVEPELVEFLLDYRDSAEFRHLEHGEQLARRFEQAGFGDVFHVPTATEWDELRQDKLPDLGAPLARALALDTHYSLRADADFEQHQEAIDRVLAARVAGIRP